MRSIDEELNRNIKLKIINFRKKEMIAQAIESASVLSKFKMFPLIFNQLSYTHILLERAQFSLLSSGTNRIVKLLNSFGDSISSQMSEDEIDKIKFFAHKDLITSIVFYNSIYDYLKILLRVIFTPYDILINDFKVGKVNEVLAKKYGNNPSLWQFALGSLITINPKAFKDWISNRTIIIEPTIKSNFDKLTQKNEELKSKYFANLIKHGSIPGYSVHPDNILWLGCSIDQADFYNKLTPGEIHLGTLPAAELNLKELQDFLTEYNGLVVELLKDIHKYIKSN